VTRVQIEAVELGYCQQCGRPAHVGRLVLPFWKHAFWICDICIEALKKAITDGATRLAS
jgi:hypothetical protein